MSMNLAFKVKGGAGWVDFPFQTPTVLSYDVISVFTKEERLGLIEDHLQHERDWAHDEIQEIISKISDLLDNENLELCVI